MVEVGLQSVRFYAEFALLPFGSVALFAEDEMDEAFFAGIVLPQ